MKFEPFTIGETIRISDVPGMDLINVIFQDTGPSQGRVWVECYGKAWASWWPAMGNRTVRQFVASLDPGYFADALNWGSHATPYDRQIAALVIKAAQATD